jgi:uncharacterized protein DUF1799
LKEAARAWVFGRLGRSDPRTPAKLTLSVREQFAGMGASIKGAQIEDDPVLKVWDMNWPAVRAFLALSTQWRRAGMRGTPVGLDYAAIEPTLKLAGMRRTKTLFPKLQLLEAFALEAFSEVAK